MNEEIKKYQRLVSGLGMRSSAMFGTPKMVEKQIKQVLPLVVEDLKELGIFKGTPFEEKYLK